MRRRRRIGLADVPRLLVRVILELAGLNNPLCKGVIVITNSDHVNLTVAITVKLLRPELPVFARSESDLTTRNLASFKTDWIIDPYAIFAERMFLALSSPIKYLLQDWLISVPGTKLRQPLNPPSGCVFHPRCPIAIEECKNVIPELREVRRAHRAACIRV